MASSSRSAIQAAIDRAGDPAFSGVEIVYSTSPSWSHSSNTSQAGESSRRNHSPIHISVLDSSFNPPHLAHLGLSTSAFPPPIRSSSTSSAALNKLSNGQGQTTSDRAEDIGDYNARLLLLSLRNVDKTPTPGDPTPLQKLEMVILLARYIDQHHPIWGGTAVGLITEPTFVGKSRIVRRFLVDRLASPAPSHSTLSSSADAAAAGQSTPEITLSFIVGTDTLVRFFNPKYYPPDRMSERLGQFFYPPPDGDGSYLVSARRGGGETGAALEEELLRRQEITPWVEKGCMRLMGTAGEGREDISSTAIRRAVQAGDEEALRKLVIPSIAEYIKQEHLYST